jgi:hypothetical protein
MKDLDIKTTLIGVAPVKGHREPVYKEDELIDAVAEKMILQNSTMFTDKAKDTNIDYERAAEVLDRNKALYQIALKDFGDKSYELSKNIKNATANVRDSAEKLAQGLVKCQKVADFNNLERYVLLLERAASAMTILADLEKNGKLERISQALK